MKLADIAEMNTKAEEQARSEGRKWGLQAVEKRLPELASAHDEKSLDAILKLIVLELHAKREGGHLADIWRASARAAVIEQLDRFDLLNQAPTDLMH